jgi:hypothetical protein
MLKATFRHLVTLTLLLNMTLSADAQQISGLVLDAEIEKPLFRVKISSEQMSIPAFSGADGRFEISDVRFPIVLQIENSEYETVTLRLDEPQEGEVTIKMFRQVSEGAIPTISLTETQLLDDESSDQNISGLLTASDDLFYRTAAFTFGPARFNLRGYTIGYTPRFINGVPINDMENGRVYFGFYGGLNDVFRMGEEVLTLDPVSFDFGGLGGASTVDTRASVQRKQTRVSYSSSNRSYRHRIMATHSSGLTKNGWAYTISGSTRWAEEGYIPGTFYESYSYFASVDKLLGRGHSLNLGFMGSWLQRGRTFPSVQEMNDLAGTNYYNPNWGYQDGRKRNARVGHNHQPLLTLRHDYEIGSTLRWTNTIGYQFGSNGFTSLDWYNARDPRPDYYRKLPSFNQVPEVSEQIAGYYASNESARQIDWTYLYNANRNNHVTIEDAEGIPGNSVSGNRSLYIIEDRLFDHNRFSFNSSLNWAITNQLTWYAGLRFQDFTVSNYKRVEDLLGGDFYLDIDKFAERDLTDPDAVQIDLNNPNNVLYEGDVFGYNYDAHIREEVFWSQWLFSLNKWEISAGGALTFQQLWREGFQKNGKFPANSFGKSEVTNLTGWKGKIGTTYKLDGRNYLFANGGYFSNVPYFRNIFISPRTRFELVSNIQNEEILSYEVGFVHNSPGLNARIVFYDTQFENLIENRNFFLDQDLVLTDGSSGQFINYIIKNVARRHRGIEASVEVKLSPVFKLGAVAAVGEYIFTKRPRVDIILDNQATALVTDRIIYAEQFFVPGTPQSAYSLVFRYDSPKFWFLNLNANFFDRMYLDFNMDRRTLEAVSYGDGTFVEPGSPLWNEILHQEKLPSAFTVDVFGGKSWRLKNGNFIYLTVGINNLLNNNNFITGGFEQLRFDYETKDVSRFPPRYFYAYGANYFANISYRL